MIGTQKNIYCLEGNWSKQPNSKLSIKPILDLLHTTSKVKYIYNKCQTKNDFLIFLERFTQKRYKNYPILYIAFHGRINTIFIGNEEITLQEISNVLEGKLEGKIVHFGSCSTLKTTNKKISDFIHRTKCNFISGYKKEKPCATLCCGFFKPSGKQPLRQSLGFTLPLRQQTLERLRLLATRH